jgi:hypothetical protein
MRAARYGVLLGAAFWLGFSVPADAQALFPVIGKQPPSPQCTQVCQLVRTVATTPYPHDACFTSPAGRTLCQAYTQYRSDDRYVRRCFWSCPTRG